MAKFREYLYPTADFGLMKTRGKIVNRRQDRAVEKEALKIGTALLNTELDFLEVLMSKEFIESGAPYEALYNTFQETFVKNFDIVMRKYKPKYTVWNKVYFRELYKPVV